MNQLNFTCEKEPNYHRIKSGNKASEKGHGSVGLRSGYRRNQRHPTSRGLARKSNQETKIMKLSRHWAMPTADTFECPPIADFVRSYVERSKVSIDPFSRNSRLATYRNDINPNTCADYHLDAVEFLEWFEAVLVRADLVLLDPPYSPRQISECYMEIGKPCGMEDTQNGSFYKEVRDAADKLTAPGGVVISCGWNSSGMGKGRGYEIEAVMLVCHGGAHNDTICMAERKIVDSQLTFPERSTTR